MSKVKIIQTRSLISRPEKQRQTLKALGLGKINKMVEVELTPQVQGMIRSVNHLIKITEISK
jgi:large subunit ribosomal protein L30